MTRGSLSWGGIPLFGMLLCTLVVVRFVSQTRGAMPMFTPNPRVLVRGLSREVYLILYTLLLVRMIGDATTISWCGADMTIGWSPLFESSPELVILNCGERFRGYILCGAVALSLVRVLSALKNTERMSWASRVRTADVGTHDRFESRARGVRRERAE